MSNIINAWTLPVVLVSTLIPGQPFKLPVLTREDCSVRLEDGLQSLVSSFEALPRPESCSRIATVVRLEGDRRASQVCYPKASRSIRLGCPHRSQ
jgi:hypothetical protein